MQSLRGIYSGATSAPLQRYKAATRYNACCTLRWKKTLPVTNVTAATAVISLSASLMRTHGSQTAEQQNVATQQTIAITWALRWQLRASRKSGIQVPSLQTLARAEPSWTRKEKPPVPHTRSSARTPRCRRNSFTRITNWKRRGMLQRYLR